MRKKEHETLDKLLLGKSYPKVHEFADLVKGPGHRKLWGHDLEHVLLTYLITKDRKATLSHILHILSDKYASNTRRKRVR